MDHRPDVNRPAAGGGRVILRAFQPQRRVIESDAPVGAKVTADQVIFTSIRSPMGEGYRIVAASTGVKPQEKAEITRRSPSHGGLCGEGEDATGLIAYPLPTGRYCVAHCSHAGAEHTARGGLRVMTHLAILDRAAFESFACNPVLVHASLGRVPELPKLGRGPVSIDPIALSVRDNLTTRAAPQSGDGAWLASLAAGLLGETRWVMHGLRAPLVALDWAYELVPMALRSAMCVSVGVRFAPSRQTAIALLEGGAADVERAIRGHAIECANAGGQAPPVAGRFERWLALVQENVGRGRLPRIARLARQMAECPTAETLNRIAGLVVDREKVEHLDEAGLRSLQQSHSGATPSHPQEADLRTRLLDRISERLAEATDERVVSG